MSRYLVDRIERNPRTSRSCCTPRCASCSATTALEAVVVEDNRTGERETLEARALFVFIGARRTRTGWADSSTLDDGGYILTGPRRRADAPASSPTARARAAAARDEPPGVFAVGDVRSGSIKRVASAVGEGSMAVRLVHERIGDRASGEAVVHTQT